jgi:hypothetical protein
LFSTFAISTVASLSAQAQRARENGNDANPCTGGSPCKTFQHAHEVVLPGGEISILDTGGYGTLTITKSLSIVNPLGVEASIATASGQAAITINAGPIDVVSLRGLTLGGTGVGEIGILFTSGATLEIADCVARGYTGRGLFIAPSAAVTFKVTNSEFNDNAVQGIVITPSGTAQVTQSPRRGVTFSPPRRHSIAYWGRADDAVMPDHVRRPPCRQSLSSTTTAIS